MCGHLIHVLVKQDIRALHTKMCVCVCGARKRGRQMPTKLTCERMGAVICTYWDDPSVYDIALGFSQDCQSSSSSSSSSRLSLLSSSSPSHSSTSSSSSSSPATSPTTVLPKECWNCVLGRGRFSHIERICVPGRHVLVCWVRCPLHVLVCWAQCG